MSIKTYIHEIRQGERREYRILRYGLETSYRIQSRNPDSWFKSWATMKTQGCYYNDPVQVSSCHDALATIDSDVRHRRSMAMGWTPVTCDSEGAANR